MTQQRQAQSAARSRGMLGLAAAMVVVAAGCTDRLTDASAPAPVPPPVFGTALDQAGAPFVEGQLLVRFRPGAARNEIAEQNRARPREELRLERIWLLDVEPGEELAVAANLRNNPNVEFAEPNYVYTVVPCGIGDCTAPTDALFGAKWDLHNPGVVTDAFGNVVATTDQAGADVAWLEAFEHIRSTDMAMGSAVVAIIDTGLRAAHQEFAGKVAGGRNFCPPLLCLLGTPNPANWADDNGHGTHVAGIAAARGNDGLGVPGIAYMPEVQILAVKVCGTALGLCNAAAIVNGIIWAVDNGAHVLNLSLGGGAPNAAQQVALQYALDNNVLPVCASGNDGQGTVSFPAAFPQCMAVGSTGWGDERASYSNFGPQIEVTAPGGDASSQQPHSLILSSWFTANNAYAYAGGTSMASPQVAGLAALLRASGMTSAAEIRARIRATADDLGPAGFDNEYGDGRINVYRALTLEDPFIPFTVSSRPVINLMAQGRVQLVVLGREAVTFDLGMLAIETVTFGGAPVARRPNGTYFATWSDIDGDGLLDVALHFEVPAIVAGGEAVPGATHLTLRGSLSDGRNVRSDVAVTLLN